MGPFSTGILPYGVGVDLGWIWNTLHDHRFCQNILFWSQNCSLKECVYLWKLICAPERPFAWGRGGEWNGIWSFFWKYFDKTSRMVGLGSCPVLRGAKGRVSVLEIRGLRRLGPDPVIASWGNLPDKRSGKAHNPANNSHGEKRMGINDLKLKSLLTELPANSTLLNLDWITLTSLLE